MITLALALLAATPLAVPPPNPANPASPPEIVATAPAGDWLVIAPSDLLVMDLLPDPRGRARRVVIQLLPAPYSQAWVRNIRRLAAARWWDGTSINRAQDNYVVQWGDAEAEDKARAKRLPAGLETPSSTGYVTPVLDLAFLTTRETRTPTTEKKMAADIDASAPSSRTDSGPIDYRSTRSQRYPEGWHERDAYADWVELHEGWPLASEGKGSGEQFWPVHCYGTVGVGRDMPPDAGTGAELYAVIGQAPRQLDRNIAVVGRVIEGIEHLSTLPRGTGPLGFYETAAKRVPIVSVRIGDQVPGLPRYQYLSTESDSFARYADARANRRDRFFIAPAGGTDICNVPVPIRRAPTG